MACCAAFCGATWRLMLVDAPLVILRSIKRECLLWVVFCLSKALSPHRQLPGRFQSVPMKSETVCTVESESSYFRAKDSPNPVFR